MKQQTVLVTKISKQSRKGIELTSARSKVYKIVSWYDNGKCRTTSGDIWEVIVCTTGHADYLAIK